MSKSTIPFSPKLKKAMAEIRAILKKNDIAGFVVVHTPGFSEYMLSIETSYSCAKLVGTQMLFKSLSADFKGEKKEQLKMIADTANMLNMISECTGDHGLKLIKVSEKFDEIVMARHENLKQTSDQEFNN